MGLEPLSIRQMESQTEDVFEAVTVMAQRARQVMQDRFLDQAMKEGLESEYEVYDEVEELTPENYEEKDKVTTVASDEFMTGDLVWKNALEEE
ncbi:MAG: hypothetical protein ISS10_00105 [Candidatus Marinimicrobia bacterium]|nr:hypothetical protein [Candidatus Neomarinimicrobiota bacterium]MBL7059381.1 hypothetical protein [Candidatus Neomarinimicrobiota bacterium]